VVSGSLKPIPEEWMKVFSYTLKEVQRLDLGVDLANASGWSFGGPWVSAEDACKDAQYKFYTVRGGTNLRSKLNLFRNH
jgi:hypothetical protein